MQNHNLKFKIGLLVFGLLMFLFLNQVFSGRLILPQSFLLGPLQIHYYGLIMALAVLAGYTYASWSAERFGYTKKQFEDLAIWIVPICFLSARVYHVLSEWGYYQNNLGDIVKIWQGGLSIFGVIFGGILGLMILRKTLHLKFSLLNLFDWLAPAVLLGQIIGRFGNFFNYEAYGYPTALPWKMFVPENFRIPEFINTAYYHPWFLYEALANLVFFLVVLYFVKNRKFVNFPLNNGQKWPVGTLFFSYILWYNALRFLLEFLRIDSILSGNLRVNGLVALTLALAGFLGLVWSYKCSNTTN